MSLRLAPESVVRFVAELDDQVRSILGDQLVATILHGSAALGGFVPGRSDVDVLMLVDQESIALDRLRGVAERIHTMSDGCPGIGLELSVVSAPAAADPASPWPYLLHATTGVDGPKTIPGVDRDGDPDLLMHYAVCRVGGVSITGPPATDLIGEIGRVQILGSLHNELTWAVGHADATYRVLNACRAWQYAVTGELVSKLDGASWALRAGGPTAVIAAAVAAQTSTGDGPTRDDADDLIRTVQSIIEHHTSQPSP